jgi:hypothetical protein
MSSGDELGTVYSTTPSIVDMRDALLLVIPVREDTVLRIVTFLNPVYVYMITLSANPVNRSNYLSGTV